VLVVGGELSEAVRLTGKGGGREKKKIMGVHFRKTGRCHAREMNFRTQ